MRKQRRTQQSKFYEAIFSALFRRKHPYAIAAYLGRKNAQNILGCKIKKMKQW